MVNGINDKKKERPQQIDISKIPNKVKEGLLLPQGHKLIVSMPDGKTDQVYEVIYRNVGKLRVTLELKGQIKKEAPLITVPGRDPIPGKSGLILPG